MPDDQNKELEQEQEQDTNYIEIINDMKKNMVSREEFSKVKKENKQLLDALINNKQIGNQEKPAANKAEIIKNLTSGNLSNLDYARNALELRKACMDAGERDPFLPCGHNITPTAEDEAAAERVADAFAHCIEYADGDSGVFTNELQRITRDVRVPRRI